MKTIPPALVAHLAGEVTRLASLFTISRKDGVIFRFTDHDRDLVHAGQTYRGRAGYERTAVTGTSGLETDSLEVAAVFDDEGITEHDLLAGAFDHAEITLALVRWDDPGQGLVRLRRGQLGETTTRDGSFEAELRGLVDALKQEFGQIYGPTCRADLGDARCGIDLSLHVQTAAITTVLGQDSFTLALALDTGRDVFGIQCDSGVGARGERHFASGNCLGRHRSPAPRPSPRSRDPQGTASPARTGRPRLGKGAEAPAGGKEVLTWNWLASSV